MVRGWGRRKLGKYGHHLLDGKVAMTIGRPNILTGRFRSGDLGEGHLLVSVQVHETENILGIFSKQGIPYEELGIYRILRRAE